MARTTIRVPNTNLKLTPDVVRDAGDSLCDAIKALTATAGQTLDDHWTAGDLEATLVLWQQLKDVNKEVEEARKKLGALIELFGKSILPTEFELRGFDQFRSPSACRSFTMRTEYTARVVDKEAGYVWLRENGGADLIQETVNAGTLKSFLVSKLNDEGVEPPEEVIKLNSFSVIGSNKYTPKPDKLKLK